MEKIYYEVYKDKGGDNKKTVFTCDTYQEAVDYVKGTLSGEEWQTLKDSTGGFPLVIDKWRTVEGAAPELLGEGDLQPLCTCDICGKDLYDGDTAYSTTTGSIQVECEGFIASDCEPWLTVACPNCGERISEKICDLYQRPARPAPGGHSEGKLELSEEIDGFTVLMIDNEPIAHVEVWGVDGDENLEAESKANARRFVALWNSCLKVSTSALEDGVIEEIIEIIKTTLEDCEMALTDEWDRSNQGFEAMAEAARKILKKLEST